MPVLPLHPTKKTKSSPSLPGELFLYPPFFSIILSHCSGVARSCLMFSTARIAFEYDTGLSFTRICTSLTVFRYLLHHFSPFFCYVGIISYFCSVEGDSQGVCRAMGSTSNKTARGGISTKLARSTCEGGIFFAYILLIQPLIRRFQYRVHCCRHFIRLSTNSVAAFNI